MTDMYHDIYRSPPGVASRIVISRTIPGYKAPCMNDLYGQAFAMGLEIIKQRLIFSVFNVYISKWSYLMPHHCTSDLGPITNL